MIRNRPRRAGMIAGQHHAIHPADRLPSHCVTVRPFATSASDKAAALRSAKGLRAAS
jgi:hypothetical protein